MHSNSAALNYSILQSARLVLKFNRVWVCGVSVQGMSVGEWVQGESVGRSGKWEWVGYDLFQSCK